MFLNKVDGIFCFLNSLESLNQCTSDKYCQAYKLVGIQLSKDFLKMTCLWISEKLMLNHLAISSPGIYSEKTLEWGPDFTIVTLCYESPDWKCIACVNDKWHFGHLFMWNPFVLFDFRHIEVLLMFAVTSTGEPYHPIQENGKNFVLETKCEALFWSHKCIFARKEEHKNDMSCICKYFTKVVLGSFKKCCWCTSFTDEWHTFSLLINPMNNPTTGRQIAENFTR